MSVSTVAQLEERATQLLLEISTIDASMGLLNPHSAKDREERAMSLMQKSLKVKAYRETKQEIKQQQIAGHEQARNEKAAARVSQRGENIETLGITDVNDLHSVVYLCRETIGVLAQQVGWQITPRVQAIYDLALTILTCPSCKYTRRSSGPCTRCGWSK
jgi:lantibiotic modifying enzyme